MDIRYIEDEGMFLKKARLCARPAKITAIKLPSFGVQSIDLAIFLVLLIHEFGDISFTPHSNTPSRVIYLSVVGVLDHMPDLIRPVRKIFDEPVMEQQLDGAIQPDKSIG